MTRLTRLCAVLLCFFATLSLHAQERGYWNAASDTAKHITGDISFTKSKIVIDFASYTYAQIRTLQPAEAHALFNTDTPGQGNLYRVEIPAEKRFLHHNTLCGDQETDWVITLVTGHTLQVAFLSGPSIPTLTIDSVSNGTRLCGLYTYAR
jgi:hypothetical protein